MTNFSLRELEPKHAVDALELIKLSLRASFVDAGMVDQSIIDDLYPIDESQVDAMGRRLTMQAGPSDPTSLYYVGAFTSGELTGLVKTGKPYKNRGRYSGRENLAQQIVRHGIQFINPDWHPKLVDHGRTTELLELHVHPDAQNEGCGTALVDAALNDAYSKRIDRMRLFTDTTRLHGFFARWGFVDNNLTSFYPDPKDRVRSMRVHGMILELDEAKYPTARNNLQ